MKEKLGVTHNDSYGTKTNEQYRVIADANTAKANKEQSDFIQDIVDAARARMNERTATKKVLGDPNMQRLFYLTGDGGVGKTFVYNVSL